MSQRKPNRKAWYSLALSVLLCVGILVLATGTAFARYRAERREDIGFRVRVPDQVHFGTVSTVPEETEPEDETQATDPAEPTGETEPPVMVEVFTPSEQLKWETEDGVTRLEFAVANGVSEDDYSARDQAVRLRVIGSLGIWNGTKTPTLSLVLPPEEGSEEEVVVTATVAPFAEGTALKMTYGDGWLYTFLDEQGEELFWELPGGELSFITMTIVIEGEVPENLNLLQPQVVAEPIRK